MQFRKFLLKFQAQSERHGKKFQKARVKIVRFFVPTREKIPTMWNWTRPRIWEKGSKRARYAVKGVGLFFKIPATR